MRRYWLDDEVIHVQRKVARKSACGLPLGPLVEITLLPELWTPCDVCFPPNLRSLRARRADFREGWSM